VAVYGVLGDIHGNREALAAALDALGARGVERILCVGDVVGYNADPDECALLLRACEALAVSGDHDLIGTGRLGFEGCSSRLRYSLKRTRRRLSAASREWLLAQPASRTVEGSIALLHAGVRDVKRPMRTPEDIRRNAALLEEDLPGARICFFGHSQVQKLYEVEAEAAEEVSFPLERVLLRRDVLIFANPGSVDAQCKPEQRFAECAVFDSDQWSIEFIRVPYDAEAAEAKAEARGYRIGPITEFAYSLRRA
jgi:predicted phosphodiesterase